MNTPNPLLPQGALQEHQSKGKSTFRIAFMIVAIHAVFFTGLLWQGCRRDGVKSAGNTGEPTNNLANELPKIDTNYYSSFAEVPAVATNVTTPAATVQTTTPAPSAVTSTVTPPAATSIVASARSTPAVATAPETKEYTVVRGDSLYKIAKAQHVTISAITKANPGIDPSTIRPGQKLQIPVAAAAGTGVTGLAEPAAPEKAAGGTHVVTAGETLTKIAQQYGTTAKAIKAANPNMKTDRLLVGQKLKLPASAAAPAKTNKSGSSAPGTTTPDQARLNSPAATNLRFQ